MDVEMIIKDILEQMGNVEFEYGEMDDVECSWIIENKTEYNFDSLSVKIFAFDQNNVVISRQTTTTYDLLPKLKVKANITVPNETVRILLKFENCVLDGSRIGLKDLNNFSKETEIQIPQKYWAVENNNCEEILPQFDKDMEKADATEDRGKESEMISYTKKEKAIKFLYSIDILSEKEMEDIINYLQGYVVSKEQILEENQPENNHMFNSCIDEMLISDIEELSIRARNILKRAGILRISDIKKYSKLELMHINLMGAKSWEEILNFIDNNIIILKDDKNILLNTLNFSKGTLYCLRWINKKTVGDIKSFTREDALTFVNVCKARDVDYFQDMFMFEACGMAREIIDILIYPHLYE